MRAAYRAVLRGNLLEWRDEKPQDLSQDRALEVSVTVLGSSDSAARGVAMAAALRSLAAAGGPESYGDAASWERDARSQELAQ